MLCFYRVLAVEIDSKRSKVSFECLVKWMPEVTDDVV